MKPKLINGVWSWVVDWFEHGDLVPLLVVVSAWHYAAVLADADAWPVAIAIGILVDIGHFRTIRAAFRYNVPGKRRRRGWPARMAHAVGIRINGQLSARWMIALTMTAISLAYHQRYYDDWWLSAPIPFLIAALAWLGQVDGRGKKPPSENATHSATHPTHKKTGPTHTCKTCGATFARSTALATHVRWSHQRAAAPEPERANGKAR